MRIACAACVALAAPAAALAWPPERALEVTGGGRMAFLAAAAPQSRGTAVGTDNFAFLSSRLGFAATTGGAGWIPHTGYEGPYDAGRIERTDDGGATWRTVWRRRHVVFSAIVFASRRVGVAAGAVVSGRDPALPKERPILVRTTDGGRSWHVLPRPPFSPYFFEGSMYSVKPVGLVQLPGESVWYAFAGELSWPSRRPALWRSTDAGSSWKRVRVPVGTSIVAFPSPRVGYAAAQPRGCRTADQLWKTLDGGATWRALPGTCGPGYTSLDFLDADRGFTSEATGADVSNSLRIRATTDGGSNWDTRFVAKGRRSWAVYTRLAFRDELSGWAVSSEWNQGFPFNSLHVTADGGRTWTARRYPQLPDGVFGALAWAGPWRTADRGKTWQVSVRPGQLWPDRLVLASRDRLDVHTGAGTIESLDGGRTWKTRPTLSPFGAARVGGAIAYVQPAGTRLGRTVAYLRTTRGWRPLLPPSLYGAGAVAFIDGRNGLVAAGSVEEQDVRVPVYRTVDSGRSWTQVRVPGDSVLLAPGTIMTTDDLGAASGMQVALSVDAGRHWRRLTLPGKDLYCSLSRPTTPTIWILCAPFDGKETTLLRSDDGGTHWTRLTGPTRLDTTKLAATGRRTAWAIGTGSVATGAPLWHTTDGGRTWIEVWPRLSPSSRAYELLG